MWDLPDSLLDLWLLLVVVASVLIGLLLARIRRRRSDVLSPDATNVLSLLPSFQRRGTRSAMRLQIQEEMPFLRDVTITEPRIGEVLVSFNVSFWRRITRRQRANLLAQLQSSLDEQRPITVTVRVLPSWQA